MVVNWFATSDLSHDVAHDHATIKLAMRHGIVSYSYCLVVYGFICIIWVPITILTIIVFVVVLLPC